jgi:ribosomal protein S18 acetylase RimI-like enzyme
MGGMQPLNSNWRLGGPHDDDPIVSMCLALNAEDPGPNPVSAEQIRRTLTALRAEPWRGAAVVCDAGRSLSGYALLISFWSNELGGEICVIDELFVRPAYRGRGLATALIERLMRGDRSLWSRAAAALALEVTPENSRARALYERLGFRRANVCMQFRMSDPKAGESS